MEINKLILGDCYDHLKILPDKSIDLLVTDPPYRIHAESGGGLHNKRDWLKNVHDSNLDEFEPDKFLIEVQRVLKVFNAYIYCSKDLLIDYITFAKDNNYNWDLLCLCKKNPIPTKNNKYLSDLEYCMFIREKGAYFNSALSYDKYYKAKSMNVKKAEYHPTEKPFNIICDHIEISSKEGDLILDPFVGSGTTVLACKKLKRNYLAFEINAELYKNAQKKISGLPSNISFEDTFFTFEDLI